MRLVVADAGPLHYLVLTNYVEVLPQLFQSVLTPRAVRDELSSPKAPEAVRTWIAQSPPWLEIHADPAHQDIHETVPLDRGERAAIALALAVKAALVLMDDQDGAVVARQKGLAVTGTLGILDLAARRGLIDLAEAFGRLKATSFYYRQGLLDVLLAQHAKKDRES